MPWPSPGCGVATGEGEPASRRDPPYRAVERGVRGTAAGGAKPLERLKLRGELRSDGIAVCSRFAGDRGDDVGVCVDGGRLGRPVAASRRASRLVESGLGSIEIGSQSLGGAGGRQRERFEIEPQPVEGLARAALGERAGHTGEDQESDEGGGKADTARREMP